MSLIGEPGHRIRAPVAQAPLTLLLPLGPTPGSGQGPVPGGSKWCWVGMRQ